MKIKPTDAPYFAYPGGKAQMRNYISHFIPPEGSTYVEPFAGRGNVFFLISCLCNYDKYVLNDIRTIRFFKAIKNWDGCELRKYTKEEVKLEIASTGISNQLAVMEPLLTWGGGMYESTNATTYRGHDLARYAESLHIAKVLLEGVELTSLDFAACFAKYSKDPEATIYLDPPYLNCNVSAYNENDFNFGLMCNLVKTAKARIILSEYPNEKILSSLAQPSYKRLTSTLSKKKKEYECLWLFNNPNAPFKVDMKFDAFFASKFSFNLIEKLKDVTWEQWVSSCPPHWSLKTIDAQWRNISRRGDILCLGDRKILIP